MADQTFTVHSGFYDSQSGDRLYTADEMNMPYKRIIADGVFATPQGTASTDLQALAVGGTLHLTVKAGMGLFGGKWFENEADIDITVPANTSQRGRIDSVIAQVDTRASGRAASIVYRTGTPAVTPAHPDINQTSGVLEWRLADIAVAASASGIWQENITDLRGSADCPWCTSLIKQVDTQSLFIQWEDAYANYYERATTQFENYAQAQKEAWEAWLDTLTSELTVTTNVIKLQSRYTASASVTRVPIGIPVYDKDTDALMVYVNGAIQPTTAYTIDGSEVVFSSAISSGTKVDFVVLHSVVAADVETVTGMILRLNDIVQSYSADTGWLPITLDNSITAVKHPRARMFGNRAFIRGVVNGPTAQGTTIGTVPANLIPAADHIYAATAEKLESSVRTVKPVELAITDTGLIILRNSILESGTWRITLDTCYIANAGQNAGIVYDYKGSVNTYADLPSSGMNAGDVYMVNTADGTHGIAAGDDVLWNGAEWEILTTMLSSAEIAAIVNTVS